MCNCSEKETCFDIHPEELPIFLENLKQESNNSEYGLFSCRECRQLWIVDTLSRGPFAVKAQSLKELENFDENPIRRELFTRFHGGLGEEQCKQAGCNNKALKGVAFCVQHQYPDYAT